MLETSWRAKKNGAYLHMFETAQMNAAYDELVDWLEAHRSRCRLLDVRSLQRKHELAVERGSR